MTQSAHVYSIYIIGTYEEKPFRYLTDQTGDPDLVDAPLVNQENALRVPLLGLRKRPARDPRVPVAGGQHGNQHCAFASKDQEHCAPLHVRCRKYATRDDSPGG